MHPLTPDRIMTTPPILDYTQDYQSKSCIEYNINNNINKDINNNISNDINNNIDDNINYNINNYINNRQFSPIISPENETIKKSNSIINNNTFEQPLLYSPKIESRNIIKENNINYNSPIENISRNNNYNSPIKSEQNYLEYNSPTNNVNSPIINYEYNSPIRSEKHVIINSPVKVNKPIYQYKEVEETAPISYSPAKVLPPIITYENSNTYQPIKYYKKYKHNKKSNQIPKYNYNNNFNNYLNLNSPQKTKSYDINDVSKINTQNINNYLNSSIINPYIIQYNNNQVIQKDPTEPIINNNHYNIIKNINSNNNNNYQINSLRSSSNLTPTSSQRKNFDNKGNPIYPVNLNNPIKNKVNRKNNFSPENQDLKRSSLGSISSNSNYNPVYYKRSLSEDKFDGNNLKLNQFSDYNSRASSPHESPNNTPKDNKLITYDIYNNTNNNINNFKNYSIQIPNLNIIRPTTEIQLKRQNPTAINYYYNTDCTQLITFSPNSFQMFYPNNEKYFNVPQNEIYSQQEITTYLGNDPNSKETYIGTINRLGNRHGLGRLFTPNSKKIGTWRNGQFTGWGREIRKNGDIFEGNFKNGKINGKGIYKYKDKILYVGDFENNLRQGKGEKITKNYHYIGEFNNDKIDGYGKIRFYNDKEGKFEYEGFFKRNNIEGKGIIKWKNGDVYQGQVKNGKMNGYGKFIPKNGIGFEGYFKNGVKL